MAILLVLLRHSWPELFGGGGIVGVVAFFTLSGYLITSILAADVRRFGKIRYGRFYRNRAIRLIPALVFLLAGFVFFEGVVNISGTRSEVVRTIMVALTYTMDIPIFSHGSPSMSHLWTLANEEQFYIVWPLILVFGIRFKKLKLVVGLSAAVLVIALLASLYVSYPTIERVYSLPSTWTISMVIGAMAQLGERQLSRILKGRRREWGAILGAMGLLILTFIPDGKANLGMYLFGGTAIGVCTVLIIWRVREWEVVAAPLRPFAWLGLISYAVYLWNYPIGFWLRDAGLAEGWQVPTVVFTIVAGALSWFLVESPFNNLRLRLDRKAKLKGQASDSLTLRSPAP